MNVLDIQDFRRKKQELRKATATTESPGIHTRSVHEDVLDKEGTGEGLISDATVTNEDDEGLSTDKYVPNQSQLQAGMSQLDVALARRASYKVIQKLVDEDPLSVKNVHVGGLTPLHRCIFVEDFFFSKYSFEILFKAYPEAAKIPDKDGNFPLHTACRRILEKVSIDSMGNVHTQVRFSRTRTENPPPLKKDEEVIQTLLTAYPAAAEKKNSYLKMPLHYAMENKAPLAIVEMLVKSSSKPLLSKSKNGRTPLLNGIAHMAPLDSLNCLLDVSPEAAGTGDWASSDKPKALEDDDTEFWNGNLPLHLALRNKFPNAFLMRLLDACPEVVRRRDYEGQLPLYLALLNDADTAVVTKLVTIWPDAITKTDYRGWPILHAILEYPKIQLDSVAVLIASTSDSLCFQKRIGRHVLPLHVALFHGVDSRIVHLLLDEVEEAAAVDDYYDNAEMPLHLALRALESCEEDQFDDRLESVFHVLRARPKYASTRDSERQTPLYRLCTILRKTNHTRGLQLLQEVFQAFPRAVDMTCVGGASPVTSLVEECILARRHVLRDLAVIHRIRILVSGLRHGGSLSPLCGVSGWRGTKDMTQVTVTSAQLEIFFLLFDERPDESRLLKKPQLNLNREVISGWTLLEMLADFDTPESASVLLQILKDQRHLLQRPNSTFCVSLKEDAYKTTVTFTSECPVEESTLKRVADRAKLSKCSDKLKQWGKEYGCFLRRYRVEESPKHISETCVVMFATETEELEDGRQRDVPVALKFMRSQVTFEREIEKRKETISKYVVPIKAFFTICDKLECQSDHIEDANLGVDELPKEMREHWELELFHTMEFPFLIVMDGGQGVDLHDIVNHRNISGRDLLTTMSIAIEIARILQFMNETCQVIHGDVKARNFVALSSGIMEFRAIDLDNAASIAEGEKAGQKRTSSGYLPPEMAAIENYERSGVLPHTEEDHLSKLKEQLESSLRSNDFAEVARLSIELKQAAAATKDDVAPPPVIASVKYDMWCFGCLLYYLCTGVQLFNIDVREDIVDELDWEQLTTWSKETRDAKLEKVPPGWPKDLLSILLEPNPEKRPENWETIIKDLTAIGKPKALLAQPSIESDRKHVFVSYSRRNKDSAREIHDYLAQQGVATWMDSELTPGTPGWTHAIEKALLTANLVIAVCSPSSKGSEWVAKEILVSMDLKVPILPLLIEGRPEQSIPFAIYDYQHIDTRLSLTAALPAILKSVQDIIDKK